MLQRSLLYTAVTRGKKLVVIVGSRRAVALAVRNADAQRRYTWLAERVRAAAYCLTSRQCTAAEAVRVLLVVRRQAADLRHRPGSSAAHEQRDLRRLLADLERLEVERAAELGVRHLVLRRRGSLPWQVLRHAVASSCRRCAWSSVFDRDRRRSSSTNVVVRARTLDERLVAASVAVTGSTRSRASVGIRLLLDRAAIARPRPRRPRCPIREPAAAEPRAGARAGAASPSPSAGARAAAPRRIDRAATRRPLGERGSTAAADPRSSRDGARRRMSTSRRRPSRMRATAATSRAATWRASLPTIRIARSLSL